jgi:hypothetical protein
VTECAAAFLGADQGCSATPRVGRFLVHTDATELVFADSDVAGYARHGSSPIDREHLAKIRRWERIGCACLLDRWSNVFNRDDRRLSPQPPWRNQCNQADQHPKIEIWVFAHDGFLVGSTRRPS